MGTTISKVKNEQNLKLVLEYTSGGHFIFVCL